MVEQRTHGGQAFPQQGCSPTWDIYPERLQREAADTGRRTLVFGVLSGGGHRRTKADKWRTRASIRFAGFFVPGRSNRSYFKVEFCKSLRTSLQLLQQSPGASQARSGQDDRLPEDVRFPAIPNLKSSRGLRPKSHGGGLSDGNR